MRTIEWDYDRGLLKMIDQRLLPTVFEIVEFTDYKEVAVSIKEMYVRGAPAIGAAAPPCGSTAKRRLPPADFHQPNSPTGKPPPSKPPPTKRPPRRPPG